MDNSEEKKKINMTESLVDDAQVEADRKKLQEQQARKAEKQRIKKKKRRRIILIVLLVIILVTGAIVGIAFYKQKKANEQTSVSVVVNSGESVQYANVVSIVGNEMVVTYTEKESDKESGDGSSKPSNADGNSRPDFGGSEAGSGSGERPDMGEMPEGMSFPGGDGGSMPDMSQMPEGMSFPGGESGPNKTVELEIPVGTEVYTKLGNVTTFSRLAAGDLIAIIFEEGTENILRIYMQ